MIITNSKIDVVNKKLIVPKEFGGSVTFNDKGVAEVDEKLGKYLIEAGFEEVKTGDAKKIKKTTVSSENDNAQ